MYRRIKSGINQARSNATMDGNHIDSKNAAATIAFHVRVSLDGLDRERPTVQHKTVRLLDRGRCVGSSQERPTQPIQ